MISISTNPYRDDIFWKGVQNKNKNRRHYKDVFALKIDIAIDVIRCGYTFKTAAEKYDCSWQLVKTFVREYQENSHLKKDEEKIKEIRLEEKKLADFMDGFSNFLIFKKSVCEIFLEKKLKDNNNNLTLTAHNLGMQRSNIHKIFKQKIKCQDQTTQN